MEPMQLPETINKHKDAILIYNRIVLIVGIVMGGIIVGSVIMPIFGQTPPEWFGSIALVLAGGLVGVLAGKTVAENV